MKRDVSINFCGGCNPRIERLQIAEAVKEILAESEHQVGYNDWNAKVTVYMSGCTVNCIQRHRTDPHGYVAVAGETVDSVSVNRGDLVPIIVAKVRKLLAIQESTTTI